ncbi:tol-pal system protein YbgF [Labrys miyagiensis]|nr:tol-pal system protein YbgF [Labrys miyagiensis]
MSRPMLRPASAALLATVSLAVTLALSPGLARAAQYDDGLMPPGSVGQDQTYQDQTYQDPQAYPAQRPQDGYGRQDDGQATYDQGQQDNGQAAPQQNYGQAPAPPSSQGGSYVVAQDSTMGDLLVRVQRLEGDNRRLNGTIDDLQSQIRKLQDDMKRQQEDTEYRLQALEGGGGGGAKAPAPKPVPQKQRSGQNGPGAQPQNLGSIPADNQNTDVAMQDQTGDDQPTAPPPPRQQRVNSPTSATGLPGIAVDTSRPLASNAPDAGVGGGAPAATPGTPEEEYTADYRLFENRQYEQSEAAFRSFVANHPKDKRVPDAIHWIGESLYQRKQYTDAAEQFLKVTKTYAKSSRAPASMLKLGITLAAMGEKDAACAALQAVASKYPKAGPTILSGADREIKRNACTAG